MIKTKLIELYGGPGSGKSTLAAHVFSELKYRKKSVELVREYPKERLWAGFEVNSKVQPVMHGVQFEREYAVIGNVEWVITDSPITLCGLYYQYYDNSDALLNFISHHQKRYDSIMNVERYRVLVKRVKEYDRNGRNESLSQAKEVDEMIKAAVDFDYEIEGKEEAVKDFVDYITLKQLDKVYS